MEKKKILIAGGTGLVGTRLSALLKKNNYEVSVLSRSGGGSSVHWDPDKRELDPALLENFYGIINLAGAGIADGRWTPARKRIIQQSRTAALETLYQALQPVKNRPSVFVSASAVGFYGDRGSELLTEQSIPGDGFLPETVILWEKAAAPVSDYGIRTVLYRIGVVLAKEGGALPRMALPVKLGAGSPVGSGKQFVPFIHIDDLCNAFLFAIENADMHGIYNACAPQPVTNEKLTREIGRILRRPVFLPNVPAFVLKGHIGELSHLILDSANVSSEKLQSKGFRFEYPEITEALEASL